MTPKVMTPTCEVTGLPHPILIYNHPDNRASGLANYDHSFFDRNDPALRDDAGLAVRMSRGQVLPMWLHRKKHERLSGPLLPQTRDEKFAVAVKACAGVVSRWAIDLRRPDDDLLTYMDDTTFAYVTDYKRLHYEQALKPRGAIHREKIIGMFFLKYALEQDLGHISPALVDEFLGTTSGNRKKEIGNFILNEALDVSLAPVLSMHRTLLDEGMVQPGRTKLRPAVSRMIKRGKLIDYYEPLEQKLRLVS
ncbi:MAG: hypothetical protein QFB87_00330 [Patescibacteria group bacterium]|nr:hypothetical protein [Patescibacteria group bacterium]